jgi:hypothetical protein
MFYQQEGAPYLPLEEVLCRNQRCAGKIGLSTAGEQTIRIMSMEELLSPGGNNVSDKGK